MAPFGVPSLPTSGQTATYPDRPPLHTSLPSPPAARAAPPSARPSPPPSLPAPPVERAASSSESPGRPSSLSSRLGSAGFPKPSLAASGSPPGPTESNPRPVGAAAVG